MERITGPYMGRFIAAYTVESENFFDGYAKICVAEPSSVWSAERVEKLTSAFGFRTELEAMSAAERKAREQIARMASQAEFQSEFGSL